MTKRAQIEVIACIQCGTAVEEGTAQCPYCGDNPIPIGKQDSATSPRRDIWWNPFGPGNKKPPQTT